MTPEKRIRFRAKVIDRVMFFRQLSILIHSGIGIVDSLDTLTRDQESSMAPVAVALASDLERGNPLSDGLGKFPGVFSNLQVSLIKVSESSGRLAQGLSRIADWEEANMELSRRVKAAMAYPVLVLTVTMLFTLAIAGFVLPGLLDVFQDSSKVAWPARILLFVASHLARPGVALILMSLIILATLALRDYSRTEVGAEIIYEKLQGLPVLGDLLGAASTSRYTGALGTVLSSGVDMLNALQLAAQVSGNPLLRRDASRLLADIESGQSLHEAMSSVPSCYPKLLVQLVEVGEEAGMLNSILDRARVYFDQEASFLTERLTALIEPLMMALVSSIVALILFSVFSLIYGNLSQLQI